MPLLVEPVLAIFFVINICALSSVHTLYTPLLVNVVLSLQGSIFMHYMPHRTHVSSTFLSFFARQSTQEQTQKKSSCNFLEEAWLKLMALGMLQKIQTLYNLCGSG